MSVPVTPMAVLTSVPTLLDPILVDAELDINC